MNRRTILLGLLFIIVLWTGLTFAFHQVLVVTRGTRFDFYAAWAGVQAVVHGLDPYSETVSLSIQQDQGIRFPHPYGGGFVHPPHVLLLLLPSALLPFPVFISLWISLLFILCQVSVIGGLRLMGISPHPVGMLVLCMAASFYRYTIIGITFGQPACFALGMLILALWLADEHKDYLSGAVLILAGIKPDLTFGLLLCFWGAALYRRRFKVLWGSLGTALAMGLAITILLGPSWPFNYLQAIKAYINYHTATWGLTALPFVLWLPALVVLLASVWTAWYSLRRARWHWFVAHVVTLSMIVVPQSGTYNLTMLLVPILIGWAQLQRAWRWVWLGLWWLLPWLIWRISNDPNADLRVVPWLLTIGLLVLVVTRSDTHQPFD